MTKGISLHIGLNQVDTKVYGSVPVLKGCINDAKDMSNICKSLGYKGSKILSNDSATVENVKNEIINISKTLEAGDIFLLSYSGHGTTVKDKNHDEDDGKDQAWCLYNRLLLDDELYKLWSLFKMDTRIVVVSDSCFSGTMTEDTSTSYKFIPQSIGQSVYDNSKDCYSEVATAKKLRLQCSVKLLSACKDTETALDGLKNGLFTEKLLIVWNGGNFIGDYKKFHEEIVKLVGSHQTPNYLTIGKENDSFDKEKPFIIS
jgi:metacaspase-1